MASEEPHHVTKPFRAGPADVVVRCPSATFRDAVEALLADLLPGDDSDPVTIHVHEELGTDRFTVGVGEPGREERSADATLAELVTVVSRLALDTDPGRLHLHTAALSLEDRGILVVASSGTGKSTLAAALALHGWTYVSDEMVALDDDGSRASGFPKPLVIDTHSATLLGQPVDARVHLAADDGAEWCLPAGGLPAPIADELEPVAVVFLDRSTEGSTDTPPIVTPIHPADAIVALMGQTLDAERYGADAVLVLARLAARCRCVRMTVGPLDASVAAVDELVGAPHERQQVRELVDADESDVAVHWRVPERVRSVVTGDRAVVHDTVGGTIVALDEAGTAVWLALHGDAPEWWEPGLMRDASTAGFLDQLAAHGLLDLAAPTPT